jgi:hypothetical protein
MSRLDELPPDQRAALSLLLRQRKSFAEVAAMLAIEERAVHDRAHAALAVLAPRLARGVEPERRQEIGDYLLGQQPGIAERLRTRTYLGTSEPARAWARALANELAPLAAAELPEIPRDEIDGGDRGGGPAAAPPPSAAEQRPAPAGPARGSAGDEPASAGERPSPASPAHPSGSRLGGAILLAVLVAAVVVAIVLISDSGGGSSKSATGGVRASSGTTTAGSGTGPRVSARLTLRPVEPQSRAVGLVQILTEGSTRAFYAAAAGLPPTNGFFYALWLSNGTGSSAPLGRAPAVGSNQRLEGGGPLPANAASFHEILLTRETSTRANHPGQVILSGPFSVGR